MDASTLNLGRHLDAVWQTEVGKASVLDWNLSHLSFDDWSILAGWDAGATLGPPSGRLEFEASGVISIYDSLGHKVCAVELIISAILDRILLIDYPGTSRSVVAVEPPLGFNATAIQHQAGNLFLALQFIRDHSDSILFLPRSMRESRFNMAAERFGLDAAHFYRLMNWFPAISEYVGARSRRC